MPRAASIHPAWLRATHWLNFIAVLVMAMSGWRIYNASPLFPFTYPEGITLGGWLGGALLWHFAAMWLLVANGLVYLALNLATGRFARVLLPLRLADVRREFAAAIRGRLKHDDLGRYNALQKLAYLFVIADTIVVVLAGLAIWHPVQFPVLRVLMGGYEAARRVHFFAMAGLVLFFIVHLTMVALVPRTFLLITRGR